MRYSNHEMNSSFTARAGRFVLGALLAGAALAVLTSCALPSLLGHTTGITVTIDPPSRSVLAAASTALAAGSKSAKTLVPPIDMNASTYAINGTGPNGATFSTTVAAGSSTTIATATGAWTVNASGINAAGTFITFGSTGVTVATGSTASAAITVTPIAGPGSLSLSLAWPAASVANPVIQAQLVPATGSATTLAFSTPANGSSTYSGSGIMNGYYTLTLQLLDGTNLVMGAVDVVEIVQGQTTSGSYAFSTVNSKGSIQVNITPNLLNPIPVTLGGLIPSVTPGTTEALTASVPAGTGNVTYTWYVNGVSQFVGTTLTLNSPTWNLPAGTYRVDVTAFSANGLQAGSATGTFTVSSTAPAGLQLSWNANTETNLAGYNLYMGTASGVYGAPTALGLVTTTTVNSLVSGTTYYFALAAVNTSGQESAKTAELSYKAP